MADCNKRTLRIGLYRSFFDLEAFKKIFCFLEDQFDFVLDQESPEVLFVVCFGPDWLNFSDLPKAPMRIFFSMEPHGELDLSAFDYAITINSHFDASWPNHVFYPAFLFNLHHQGRRVEDLSNRTKGESPSRFCNFIQSNPNELRERFTQLLSQTYRRVDCAGARLNNMPKIPCPNNGTTYDVYTKIDLIKHYKFTVSFENVVGVRDYISEKLIDPWLAGSVPIYLGAPNVGEYFNPESFIDCQQFPSIFEAVEHIREVDQSAELYERYHSAPVFKDAKIPEVLLQQMENLHTKLLKCLAL